MIICCCANINDRRLREALAGGARTLADLQVKTGAAMGCGRCKQAVLDEIAHCHAPGVAKQPFLPGELAPTA